MALKQTFIKAANTIFKVFASVQLHGEYVSIVDDGFGNKNRSYTNIDIIFDTWAERDVQFLSFSALLQPTDIKAYVKGQQLLGLEISTEDEVIIDSATYQIVGWVTDPAFALYTFALRRV